MDHVALNLAQGWLCPDGGCGSCAVCRAFLAGRLVDFMLVKPWGPSSWIKASAVVRPKRPQEDDWETPLTEYVRVRPMMARHKVVVFQDAHRMNATTANALLKTLEEPPPFVRIILTTSEYSRILPTVRSRCLAVPCPNPQDDKADTMTKTFGPTPGLAQLVDASRSVYEGLWNLWEDSLAAPAGAALAVSERTREMADDLAKKTKSNSRAACAEVLRCLSAWLLVRRVDKPDLSLAAVDAHRLVVGNVNSGPLFDALWARILLTP